MFGRCLMRDEIHGSLIMGTSKRKHHHVVLEHWVWYRNVEDLPRLLWTSRPFQQLSRGLTWNKHTRIAPASLMKPRGSRVEWHSVIHKQKKKRWKTWSRPCSQSAPFVAHHDMNDQGNLGEETTRLLGKDTARIQKRKSRPTKCKSTKWDPIAKEMGRIRILMGQG